MAECTRCFNFSSERTDTRTRAIAVSCFFAPTPSVFSSAILCPFASVFEGADQARMDSQNPSSGSCTWSIINYSRLTQKKYYSDIFTVGGCNWRILMYPKGVNSDHLAIYLDVPDAATLPAGWSRKAHFTLTLVNQCHGRFSIRKDAVHVFKAREADWGYTTFCPLSDLRNLIKGFVVNDTVIVKAEVEVLSVVPPIIIPEAVTRSPPNAAMPVIDDRRVTEKNRTCSMAPSVVRARRVTQPNHFDSYFNKLEEFIATGKRKEGSSSKTDSNNRMGDLISGSPSLREVEKAKQSLKECLLDLFKLNMKDRLAAALMTLARAEVGLSSDQQRLIRDFRENFDDFISDFLIFEQDNSEFELQKLMRDQIISAIKKNHEIHLSNKQLLGLLTEEEEELKKRLDEVNQRKEKLMSDWESLMTETEEMKTRCSALEKKLAGAEEKKRIAEERMSRSTAAWSSLKAQFLDMKLESRDMCEHHDEMTPIQTSREAPFESEEGTQDPDVTQEHLLYRQIVRFRSLERPTEDNFALELSKRHTYDEVVGLLASFLRLDDPSKIRLTSHNCYSQQPKLTPIKYRGVRHLEDMLVRYNQTADILYYEVLDIPLRELQGLKNLKVAFHHATNGEVVIHNIRLPKQSNVRDLLDELKKKVNLSHPDAELRLLEIFYHKIYKIFPPNEKIENINDQYWTLLAEEIPEEEKNIGPLDRLIHVYHYRKNTARDMQTQNFGEPFFLVINESETLAEVKVRLQGKLQVSDEEFSKWRFTFVSLGQPKYLDDSEVLSSCFQKRDVYGAWEQHLGLEHP